MARPLQYVWLQTNSGQELEYETTAVKNMITSHSKASFQFVGEPDFESEVLRSMTPVLAVFSAPWSRPCQVMDSVVAEVAAACAQSVKIVKVNADDNPHLSLWYGVESIPTLLCFVAGHLRERMVGTASKEAILGLLSRHRDTNPGQAPAVKP